MVSARVLNPVMLSEFCKMSASPSVSRNLPCGRQVNRIKRNLFGSPSTTEASTNKAPFNAELERHQEMATQKWGFNFRAGCPLADSSSFTWELVSFQESSFAPNMYTLTRAAHVRPSEETGANDALINERAERENFTVNVANSSLESNTDNDSCYDSQDESLAVRFTPSSLSHSLSSTTSALTLRKRQPKITEFMKERKRLAQAPKKLSPVKRLRTSSPSSSSSSGFGLGAHFGAMLKRPRHN